MDIREIAISKKYAICCRSVAEMRWLEEQFQALDISWVTGSRFHLFDHCFHYLKHIGNCCFGGDVDGMAYGHLGLYNNDRVIIEAVDLMFPEYQMRDLLELL